MRPESTETLLLGGGRRLRGRELLVVGDQAQEAPGDAPEREADREAEGDDGYADADGRHEPGPPKNFTPSFCASHTRAYRILLMAAVYRTADERARGRVAE